MTHLRPAVLALIAALLLLLPAVGDAVWRAGWQPYVYDGRCWAQVCVLTGEDGDRFLELSFSEYAPPAVAYSGPPQWGSGPQTSVTPSFGPVNAPCPSPCPTGP